MKKNHQKKSNRYVRIPERLEKYLDVPSKSMVPITVAHTAMAASFNFSHDIPHIYPTGLAIGIAIGGAICRNHFRKQELTAQQITQPAPETPQAEHLAEIIPFPAEQKSA